MLLKAGGCTQLPKSGHPEMSHIRKSRQRAASLQIQRDTHPQGLFLYQRIHFLGRCDSSIIHFKLGHMLLRLMLLSHKYVRHIFVTDTQSSLIPNNMHTYYFGNIITEVIFHTHSWSTWNTVEQCLTNVIYEIFSGCWLSWTAHNSPQVSEYTHTHTQS